MENQYDIVIPIGPSDINIISEQLEYTKKNIIGYRNIYLVCKYSNLHVNNCITINEDIFPFSISLIEKYHGKRNRNGWYLQQLIKLYAGLYIPDILDKYLVIDADTFFMKPTTFINEDKCLYNFSIEFHYPYFEHMFKLHPTLTKIYRNKSGICHHMIFEVKFIKELFSLVENNGNGQDKFYDIFLKNVTHYDDSGASEYEIYFNFMLKYHNDKITIRELKWTVDNPKKNTLDYDYITYHHWARQ
jgi:hypothetical protein